jgi:ABC-2 type transport system ATP-binding protein
MLRISDYRKKYQDSLVLTIPDLHLPNGIFWLKGTNGSGKSTLLKSLAGILHFDGNVILNEQISLKKDAIAYRTFVNFAPADPIYPDFLSGKEMIKMFASAKSGSMQQAEQYLSVMDMNSYIKDELGSYSSGMLKKLSLVLAFLGHPRLILLDEPLITVDADSLKVLFSWIKEKHEKDNCSFIIASHQLIADKELEITSILGVQNQIVQFI